MTSILLVEDQPTLRQLVSEVLEFSGYQVTAVADGREALELLQTGEYFPNLILSDMLMEPLGGDKLLQAVRDQWMLREIPFVIMSGKEQITAMQPELLREIDGYLEKPFGIADILASVQKAITIRRHQSSSDQQTGGSERLA
jgi:CheY-like chemotaxis protein